ncbi:hypothetical protein TCE0_060r19251 [Talaromyces pinophilus]|uniref:Uncharacterized protein n=1 Tax=Talaromyces pinophilus TaxID=128442 RepID=A0A6V8HTT2_TALPI|nr:hypothetical protein TCE0_060r19251 [Talaromyces pinophilus]
MSLKLSLACWDYDRTKALQDGRVRPEGITLIFLNYRVEETSVFSQSQLRFQEFDVSELSLSSYVLTLGQENPPFIAIPVFPSRFFRHQSMYINTNSGIREPSDLKGKRIGIPEYQMTAAVWQRGIMEEDFGVSTTDVEFFTGALEPSETERKSKVPHTLPAGVKVTAIRQGQNLSQMLEEGALDAIFSASCPSSVGRSSQCTHLFPDFKAVEADYFRRTRILPIMHVIAIKRTVYNANPWIARELQKAFAKSKELAQEALAERAALRYMLPWLEEHVKETRAIMGEDWWKDGFKENKHVIEKFLLYSYSQGLAKQHYKAEELFAPDGNNSRQRYLTNLRELLETGYRRYNKLDKAFKITIPIGGYSVKYRVVLPKSHLEEIKHISNNVFSWQLASRVIFAQDYTGAPDRGQWSGKALRVGIHQNLDDITQQLNQRIFQYFTLHLPQQSGAVGKVNLMEFFIPTITYVTNALLVDKRLSSDPEWLKETADFAVTRYRAADDVRQWPPYLARIVAPMIPSVRRLRRQREYVMERLRPLYNELKEASQSDPQDKKFRQKSAMGYEWLWGGAPDDVSLRDFSDTMMRTMIAAIHTTAKTISVALIDLLTQPDLLAEIREEATSATSADGSWVDIERLIKLDCFLKESQRLSPVFLFTMNRILTQDYTFKCSGLYLPKGTMVTAPAAAIATDPETFPNPNSFDGHRYRRLREQHKEGASALVLGMSTIDSLGFGLGSQACPGRFLAVNNLKLMLAHLLTGWELSLEKYGQEFKGPRPLIEYNDFSVTPPAEYSLRMRRL